jgi:hypothetical protein
VITAEKYVAIGVRVPGSINRCFVDEGDRVTVARSAVRPGLSSKSRAGRGPRRRFGSRKPTGGSPRPSVLACEAPPMAAELRVWLSRPGAAAAFLFVLTYKLGDASIEPMVKPFWVDRGLDRPHLDHPPGSR